ncbi:DUF1801 domain-containing protein [bacterium]|nr:DUF1801 domain-containing protein [bacterium]
MNKVDSHDDYIAQAAEPLRQALSELRGRLRHLLPDAEEIIAYNMPGFAISGKTIAGYAAFSKQCGIYLSPEAIASLSEEIAAAGFKATKTGITFSPAKPLPEELIERLVQASRKSLGL